MKIINNYSLKDKKNNFLSFFLLLLLIITNLFSLYALFNYSIIYIIFIFMFNLIYLYLIIYYIVSLRKINNFFKILIYLYFILTYIIINIYLIKTNTTIEIVKMNVMLNIMFILQFVFNKIIYSIDLYLLKNRYKSYEKINKRKENLKVLKSTLIIVVLLFTFMLIINFVYPSL